MKMLEFRDRMGSLADNICGVREVKRKESMDTTHLKTSLSRAVSEPSFAPIIGCVCTAYLLVLIPGDVSADGLSLAPSQQALRRKRHVRHLRHGGLTSCSNTTSRPWHSSGLDSSGLQYVWNTPYPQQFSYCIYIRETVPCRGIFTIL